MDLARFSEPPSFEGEAALRAEVREFVQEHMAGRPAGERAKSWNGVDFEFSRKLGQRGWIAMTWPKEYGGHERSAFERYVVIEELLAAGAPVAAHWIADRQSGPLVLRFGSDRQRAEVLPRIARGEAYCCIGMSEPDVGSDLASVKMRAVPADGGYRVRGTKLWTTGAHYCHYMVLFCRTGEGDRAAGTSQFLVDLNSPGITISPIEDMSGEKHFNEVHFDDVFLPSESLIGLEGDGWVQVTSELAFERSGPERFLSSITVLVELIRALAESGDVGERAEIAIGRLTAHLMALRHLSQGVAGMLERGADPVVQAAIVKDLGSIFEQEVPEIARQLVACEPQRGSTGAYCDALAYTLLNMPSFSLRGGTREILRGIIARGLGLR